MEICCLVPKLLAILDKGRHVYRLTFLYKVLNEHVAVPPDKLLRNSIPVHGSVTNQRLVIPRCSTNELKNKKLICSQDYRSGERTPRFHHISSFGKRL